MKLLSMYFLQSPVTSSLLISNISLSTLFPDTLSLVFFPQCQRQTLEPTQNNKQNYVSVVSLLRSDVLLTFKAAS